jgi:hypothetical protein
MSKEAFESKQAAIEAIAEKGLLPPNVPVGIALQEAEDLYVWCQDDKDALVRSDLDWKLVDDLPARAGALRYIQSQWKREFLSIDDAQNKWALKSPAAYELRNELLHYFLHAFYKNHDLYILTQRIASGSSHADMIQDLSDLAALGKANLTPLLSVNLDLTLLDKAESMSAEMAKLLAGSNGKKLEDKKLRILRDKAYAYMKEAVNEIRRCGQFAFWRDEERYKGYISSYIQMKRSPKSKSRKSNAVKKLE